MPHLAPGELPARINPDVVMMICTAGHVDHGKTHLVTLLTGCNTDTLKEEQERGLTIELGFAPCFLGNNLCVGIVDVPGHEKFIKNMVAGVSGIGMTVLVIAADDGVMPQTIEHVQIMQLLGVRRGLVALTKIDLVTPERRHQCTEEIREFLKTTFLADAPLCPVSSKTGEGYGEFYDVLVRQVQGVIQQNRAGIFRMPIERVFAQSGTGTVVTGIPVDGVIEVGALVEAGPGGQTGKVRGIQRFSREAGQGGQGQCLALNIPDFNKNLPDRGAVVTLPGYLKAARCFHLQVKTVGGMAKPLRNAEEIKFHTGTSEELGKLYLLDGDQIGSGQTALASVMLDHPVAAAVHDRFILRRPSPATTVAGGEILALSLGEHRPRKALILPALKEFQTRFTGLDPVTHAGLDQRIEGFLWFDSPAGDSLESISRGALIPMDAARPAVARLVAARKVLALTEDLFIHAEIYARRLDEATERIALLREGKKALSFSSLELRQNSNWPAALWSRMEADLERNNLVRKSGGNFILPAAVELLSAPDRNLMDRLLRVYEETKFQSPRPDELPGRLQAPPAQVNRLLQYLVNEGRLFRLAEHVVLSASHLRAAQAMVVSTIQQRGVLNSADFKYQIDSSRKYALAILDFLDFRRVTVRIQNDRKLTPDYQKRLV
jgi:selenocysteine-specific elongation factor